MCNFSSSFSASAGPNIRSKTPKILNKTTAPKEMIFTTSNIILTTSIISNCVPFYSLVQQGRHIECTLRALPCGFILTCHGRIIMRVHLLHFLHYFSLLPPHLPAQKSARASNAGAPNIRHARLALRLEPRKARTQDVGQRGRTTIDVVLLHFLHYFLLLHPIFREHPDQITDLVIVLPDVAQDQRVI